MTEYMKQIVSLYAQGLNAAEIAVRLGRTATAIHSAIAVARRSGDIVMRPGESETRRRAAQWRAYRRSFRSHP